MTAVRTSVCVATYNGEHYVVEQLRSVLDQIGPDDEVVIVDDASTDRTVERVRSLQDPRLRVFVAEQNRGYVRTFESALSEARGEFLVLADQDDVWLPGRLEAIVAALDTAGVVATNLVTLGGPPSIRGPYGQRDWHLREADSRRTTRNIIGTLVGNRPYYGCAMGLHRRALATVLPFPRFLVESHDLWIALYGNVEGDIRHLPMRSLARRFHEENASPARPRGIRAVLRSRLLLVRCVVELRRRRRASSA